MDWKDEASWLGIAVVSGLLMTAAFVVSQRFPDSSPVLIALISCAGFYLLSILLRIQNHRGHLFISTTIFKEKKLKSAFPLAGFGFGLALIFL